MRTDSVCRSPAFFQLPWLAICLAAAVWTTGCNQDSELRTEYGKIRNEGRSASLNGTRVLAEMFRQRGYTVNRQGAISPRLNRYQTIVWFPDRHAAPSGDVVQALETWISDGYGRTLIYIGRDYEANLSYLEQIRSLADGSNQEELQRQIAEAIVRQESDPETFWEKDAATSCDWFDVKKSARQKSQRVNGLWAKDVDGRNCSLEVSTILMPPSSEDEPDQRRLLKVNGWPFAFELARDYCDGKVIVVANGSFLLNFCLINAEHRKLADNLISACDPYGRVAFLESGPWEVRIQDRVDAHQPWAWISRPPLRYIVPHVLFWGVLLCFVLYPIFGRARRFRMGQHSLSKDSRSNNHADEQSIHRTTTTTSFRAHLVALGKLLQRSEPSSVATAKIENYLETYGKDATTQ